MERTNGVFTSKDAINEIENKLGIKIQKHQIIKYFKEELRLSLKKGTNRPSNLDRSRQQLLKCIFSVRLISRLTNKTVLINIDESSFSRNTKLSYSWLSKGVR